MVTDEFFAELEMLGRVSRLQKKWLEALFHILISFFFRGGWQLPHQDWCQDLPTHPPTKQQLNVIVTPVLDVFIGFFCILVHRFGVHVCMFLLLFIFQIQNINNLVCIVLWWWMPRPSTSGKVRGQLRRRRIGSSMDTVCVGSPIGNWDFLIPLLDLCCIAYSRDRIAIAARDFLWKKKAKEMDEWLEELHAELANEGNRQFMKAWFCW